MKVSELYITGFFFLALYVASVIVEKYVLPPEKKKGKQ